MHPLYVSCKTGIHDIKDITKLMLHLMFRDLLNEQWVFKSTILLECCFKYPRDKLIKVGHYVLILVMSL